MTLEELKTKLQKKAIIFQTGGTRPTSELGESWIGAIKWKRESDEIPKDVEFLLKFFLKRWPDIFLLLTSIED